MRCRTCRYMSAGVGQRLDVGRVGRVRDHPTIRVVLHLHSVRT